MVSGDFKMQIIILPMCMLWWRIYRVPQPVFPSESESRVWKWGVQWYKSVNKLPSQKPPTSQSQYHYIENCCCCRSDREKPFVDLSAISWLASRCQFSISRFHNIRQCEASVVFIKPKLDSSTEKHPWREYFPSNKTKPKHFASLKRL